MCALLSVETILQNHLAIHYNIYKTDVQNLPLHVSAIHGCHHYAVFTVVKLVISKWFVVDSTVTHLKTYYNILIKHKETAIKMLRY